jgi:hypothetical protein
VNICRTVEARWVKYLFCLLKLDTLTHHQLFFFGILPCKSNK